MNIENTVIQKLKPFNGNVFYIKREDLVPFSFGGNKARKAELFFKEIDSGDFDCVVTYGSSSSNHCRVVSNMCAAREMPCYIIAPLEASEPTFNSQMMKLFGAEITTVPVETVHDRPMRRHTQDAPPDSGGRLQECCKSRLYCFLCTRRDGRWSI